ncbi:MAG TPA: Ig-like domain-containing protein, partial [Verrucomicrobiae bacterium]
MTSRFNPLWLSAIFALGLSIPTRSSPFPARLAVESTSQSSFVLDARGILHAWEDNQAGQLGIGTQSANTHSAQPSPVSVPFPAGVTRWIDVAAGTFHTLAIADTGQLFAAGANGYNQLGTDNPNGQLSFMPVPLLSGKTNWIGIAAGDHSMALAADGTLYAWGANFNGQLGNGNENNQSAPQIVPLPAGVTRWVQIAAGENHSLAIADTGLLYAWGGNFYGQLGNGYNLRQSRPVAVIFPAGVTSWQRIAAGFNFSIGLGNNGLLYAWGQNSEGQLGHGDTTGSNVPVPVAMPAGISWGKIAAGGSEGFAISSTGQLYAWGGNYWGECGLGARGPQLQPAPVPFPGGQAGWADIAGGRGHTLGLGTDCRVYQWGLRFSQSSPEASPVLAAELNDLCTASSNVAPTVAIVNPTNGSVIVGPATITLQAQASDADGSVSRVDFFDGDHALGTAQHSTSVYTLSWTPSAGHHLLTARATDNLGLARNSDPVA